MKLSHLTPDWKTSYQALHSYFLPEKTCKRWPINFTWKIKLPHLPPPSYLENEPKLLPQKWPINLTWKICLGLLMKLSHLPPDSKMSYQTLHSYLPINFTWKICQGSPTELPHLIPAKKMRQRCPINLTDSTKIYDILSRTDCVNKGSRLRVLFTLFPSELTLWW